jgi:hypothetical protein
MAWLWTVITEACGYDEETIEDGIAAIGNFWLALPGSIDARPARD